MWIFSLCFISFFVLSVLSKTDYIVQSTNTVYLGRSVEENGKNFGVFLKIPFAKPPIGSFRFMPQPFDVENETIVVDATGDFSEKCVQPFFLYDSSKQSEDCLYLNVMVPKFKPNDTELNPVMFWIHGGAFVSGSASEFGVNGILRNLVSREIIVVTINYRLGPFGFWNTKSSVAPGNFGLWDQVQALKWVRDNIRAFGGDPNKVTIFGESAGGASVSLLTISPVTKDLFHQAIMMSGSSLAHWAFTYDNDPNNPSGYISEDLDCRPNKSRQRKKECFSKESNITSDLQILKENQKELECMRLKSTLDIIQHAMPPGSKNSSVHTIWTPRVDGEFLNDKPEILLETRPPYPLMIGITKEDGGMFAFYDKTFTRERFENYIIPSAIDCQITSSPEIVQSIVKYKYSYSTTPPVNADDERDFWMKQDSKMKTNSMFLIPAYKEALGALKTKSPLYMYSWDYEEAGELYNNLDNFYYKGPFHSTELKYLFELPKMYVVNETISKKVKTFDDDAVNVLGMLWTNFAKFGNPTPPTTLNGFRWLPMTFNTSNYLSIDLPISRMIDRFYDEDVTFWYRLITEIEKMSEKCFEIFS